jgi:hypothetical protein
MTDEPRKELRPGKGAHLDLTEETLDFLHSALEDMWNAAVSTAEASVSDGEGKSLDELIDTESGMQYLKDLRGSAEGWKPAQDKFGVKLYKALAWGDGEIRVTVVLNSQGSLKIDVRYWYDPDNAPTNSWK